MSRNERVYRVLSALTAARTERQYGAAKCLASKLGTIDQFALVDAFRSARLRIWSVT